MVLIKRHDKEMVTAYFAKKNLLDMKSCSKINNNTEQLVAILI